MTHFQKVETGHLCEICEKLLLSIKQKLTQFKCEYVSN